jgi:hypothetical protein
LAGPGHGGKQRSSNQSNLGRGRWQSAWNKARLIRLSTPSTATPLSERTRD